MGREMRQTHGIEQRGMHLADEAERAGDRDVGVADPVAEPVLARALRAPAFKEGQHIRDLPLAAFNPAIGDLLVQDAFVEEAHRLFGEAGGERRDLERAAALRPARRDERLGRSSLLVEMVEDRGAFDQDLAVVEHHGGHTPQGIELGELLGVAECGPGAMLERRSIEPQRDADAPHEGRIILADEDHAVPLLESNIPSLPSLLRSKVAGARFLVKQPRTRRRRTDSPLGR
jgi:hypothetical protein